MSKLKNDSPMFLANRVAEYREKKGLTQKELAKLTGTTINTISAIENRKYEPSLRLAFLLSFALDVNVYKLFYFYL